MFRNLLLILLAISAAVDAQPQIDWQADLADRNARAMAQSLCVADEMPVFTCKIGKKVASICASKVLDEKQGYVQYRFGKKDSIELEIPRKSDYNPAMVGYMSASCASCWGNYLRFSGADYRYYVFNVSTRGPNDPKTGASTRDEPSGVLVMKNDQAVYSRRCTSPAFDHNMSNDFLNSAVITLGTEDDVSPFDLAFPSTP